MKITNLFAENEFTLSFEVFPPAREGKLDSLYSVIEELVKLNPHFISVIFGAGGSTRDMTIEIASRIKNHTDTEVLAHLTCVQATKDETAGILDDFKKENNELPGLLPRLNVYKEGR